MKPANTEIESHRLKLRRLQHRDAKALFGIFSDPRVMTYWHTPAWPSVEYAQNYISDEQVAWDEGKAFTFAIEHRHSGEVMGKCLLWHYDAQSRRAEIGFGLGPDYWGQGYIQEAGMALLQFAFNHLDLNRLEAEIDPDNKASAKALERLGFKQEGYLRQRWIIAGHKSDSALYGLLREEFLSIGI
ncbi:GNAT family N-acetyltransferase [Bowmanella denitrificans]|uniref:GNAT family N-acetyltransferase n=1 Tax=Bowmanella denitrificans TaxID=366582 RepID=A0ABN0XCG4_9ALTE|nr:GNAT family N-acetyltransferase [Bowmanella denitrificans]